MANVIHRGHKRKARGYSIAEIVEAGLAIQDVIKRKIKIDSRRKSKYADNVKELKK